MATRLPTISLIGGPNGAGKTTFARHYLPTIGVIEFLNADSLAAGLSPFDPTLASVRAARLLLARWRDLVTAGRSFGFESTLSGRTYATMIREARSAGYQIRICYLALPSVQYSIRRVRERVKKGGHNVPLADLKRRFDPSRSNFFELYLPLAHEAALYDATWHRPRLVAEWSGGEPTIHSQTDYDSIHRT